MKISSSNINFNGFRNVITYDASSPMSNAYLLVAQLDNEGQEDLSVLSKLKGDEANFSTNKNDDVLVALYMKAKNFEKFFLNGDSLPCCDELKIMKNSLSKQEFLKKEAVVMKGFTFLCDLTQRIRNAGLISYDYNKNFVHVVENGLQNLQACMKNKQAAYLLLEAGILSNEKSGKVAEKINTAITKSMKRYFL